jgi:hypothetical protein
MTLVSREDARLIADIERLIKKKIELEPVELDDAPPPRRPRERLRDEDEAPRRREPRYAAPAPVVAAPSDPLFDKPYEPAATSEPPAWEQKAPAAPRGLSAYIKPKKKLAALFGAKKTEPAES